MIAGPYSAITLFCITILVVILLRLVFSKNKTKYVLLFASSIACFVLVEIVDIIWINKEQGVIYMDNELFFWVNLLYFIFDSIGSYLWFLYVSKTCISNKKLSLSLQLIVLSFLIGNGIFIVSSRFNSWVFYINNEGNYTRGPYFFVSLLIAYLFILSAAIVAITSAFKKENFANRTRYMSFFIFSISALMLSILQVLFPELPILALGNSIAFVWLFFNLQDLMISKDSQTGLQTKNYIYHLIEQRIKHDDGTFFLYIFLIDIDNFKRVNDYYGHVEGDRALLRVANIFIDYGQRDKFSAAKIGGDEFLFVVRSKEKINPANIVKELRKRLAEENKKSGAPYKITVSIGFSQYKKGDTTLDLVVRADNKMYQEKQRKKIRPR